MYEYNAEMKRVLISIANPGNKSFQRSLSYLQVTDKILLTK